RRPDRDGVLAAPLLPPQPASRGLEEPDPAERVALRLWRQLERRRDIRELPAQEARRVGATADPHDPAGGLHARHGGVVLSRLSLRTRLLVGVIGLAAVGLLAADVATYSSLRSFLVSRTDTTLRDEHQAFEGGLGGDELHAPPGVYSEVRAANGRTALTPLTVGTFRGQTRPPAPLLPQTIHVS